MKSIFTKNSVNQAFYCWILRACLATVLIFPTIASLNAAPLTSWDKKINNAAQRFKVLPELGGVLDLETQLVWEQAPTYDAMNWTGAISHCNQLKLGNRLGWRLPTITELMTLFDLSNDTAFPIGHPFTLPSGTWSSTQILWDSKGAWISGFYIATIINPIEYLSGAWCVRGKHPGYD